MSAAIIPLPGASPVPVATRKLPPGRPPKNVASIRRGAWLIEQKRIQLAKAAALEREAREIREMIASRVPGHLSYAAELEAQARALRQRL